MPQYQDLIKTTPLWEIKKALGLAEGEMTSEELASEMENQLLSFGTIIGPEVAGAGKSLIDQLLEKISPNKKYPKIAADIVKSREDAWDKAWKDEVLDDLMKPIEDWF